MNNETLSILATALCSLVGTFGGIVAGNKITAYRLGELEKRVEEQSEMFLKIPVLENRIGSAEHRLSDLEEWQKKELTNK